MSVGQRLREARETKNLTLETVEEETKIRKKYLRALEEEDFDVLPGRVYARAFLRTYARFLELDAEELLSGLRSLQVENREEAKSEPVKGEPVLPSKSKERPSRVIQYVIAAAAVIGMVVFGSLYSGNENDPRKDIGQTSPPPTVQEPPPPATIETPEPLEKVLDLNLRVDEGTSWMRVVVDGNVSYDGFLTAGNSLEFTGQERIFIHVGNAGVVKATLNGEDLGRLGENASVVRREFTI